MRRARPLLVLALASALAACGSTARDTDNPDWAQAGMPPPPKITAQADEWKEAEVPPPPAFSESRLIPIEMPAYSSLKFGVDPATLSVTGDGVVRYVVVANSKMGGGTNAFYEGIRCASEEVKQYARYGDGAWQVAKTPEWKRIDDRNSRYAKELALQGVCRGHAPRASVREMVQQMKNPLRELP
ncbi:CNP1-like family protein [Variovorax sp. PBS-H4]|uniref:CNP1-like family protein n=1 Tax=Variovorax sp. PBS-H4 TaxID=434008 RepID=UPI001316058D|nr:CNP1-like family protein [Variovorax sp. PBS-H4]VTU24539.1 CNP1-like family protein [Variovorax sp. PBS-H4]